MSLFPLEPLPDVEPEADLSPDQRRTKRRVALLAQGFNPRTRLPLLESDEPHTCGDCAHHFVRRMGQTYHKCDHGVGENVHVSFGPATDVRVSWPACTAWQAVE